MNNNKLGFIDTMDSRLCGNIILMGTSDWVVPIFERISAAHNIVAVFTRAPKPAGRKMVLTKSPVHVWAESKNIPVETSIKNIINYQLSIINYVLVASYGVIIPDDILAQSKFINIHPSLLPKYRGPSPMLTALYNGDDETGVCIMDVAHDVDAGDIYRCEKIQIGENDTIADLENKVTALSGDMIMRFLENPTTPTPQIGTPTYTKKFTRDDTIIDWSRTPEQIHNQVRSIGGRTKINGADVKILKTRIDNGQLFIDNIQPAGGKPMDWKSFVNGQRGQQIKFGE